MIRPALAEDVTAIQQLFYDTITAVNSKDYNPQQIRAWAKGHNQVDRWLQKINDQHFFVAESNGVITGFAAITCSGHLDYLFVHKNFQQQGIAKSLLSAVEQIAKKLGVKEITSDVSITARSFFEKHGFTIITDQLVEVRGVQLTNYKAVKSI